MGNVEVFIKIWRRTIYNLTYVWLLEIKILTHVICKIGKAGVCGYLDYLELGHVSVVSVKLTVFKTLLAFIFG